MANRAEVAVVKTFPLAVGEFLRIIECQNVSARHYSQERRQRTPLLQRGGEQACGRWARTATARAVSGGDQLVARAGVFHAIVTVDFRGVTGHFKNIVTGFGEIFEIGRSL